MSIRYIRQWMFYYSYDKNLGFENKSSNTRVLFKEKCNEMERTVGQKRNEMENDLLSTSFCYISQLKHTHKSIKWQIHRSKKSREREMNRRLEKRDHKTMNSETTRNRSLQTKKVKSSVNQFDAKSSKNNFEIKPPSTVENDYQYTENMTNLRFSSNKTPSKTSTQIFVRSKDSKTNNEKHSELILMPKIEEKDSMDDENFDPFYMNTKTKSKESDNKYAEKDYKSDPAKLNEKIKENETNDIRHHFNKYIKRFHPDDNFLKNSFKKRDCLSSKMKNLEYVKSKIQRIDFNNLKIFWYKFGKDQEITEQDIFKLHEIEKLIFESYLVRKEYSEKMIWNVEHIKKINGNCLVKRTEDNIKYILKVCYRLIFKNYKKEHYNYSSQKHVKDFLSNMKSKEKLRYGFLHKYFHNVAFLNGKSLDDFDINANNLKDRDSLKKFIALIYLSEDFKRKVEFLTSKESIEKGKGICQDFQDQLHRKIDTKIKHFTKIFNSIKDYRSTEGFEWLRSIRNDFLYNPKCKLPWTIVDLKRALSNFRDAKDECSSVWNK